MHVAAFIDELLHFKNLNRCISLSTCKWTRSHIVILTDNQVTVVIYLRIQSTSYPEMITCHAYWW